MTKIKYIFYSVCGLFLLLPFFASAEGVVIPDVADVVVPPNAGPTGSIVDILQNFMYWLLAVVGILGVISFIISGIMYLTAAGNESQIERAKKTMIYSIVGVIVSMLGVIIMKAATTLLSGNSSSF